MKILFIFLIAVSVSLHAQSSEVLSKMSAQERYYLKEFFKVSIRRAQWGFSLFFDKPVSLNGFFIHCPSNEIPSPYQDRLLKQGWNVWKKYENSISKNHFVFCEEKLHIFDRGREILLQQIYLVNKQALLTVIDNNKAIFKEKLGDDFSPEQLLLAIEDTRELMPHLMHDEVLLGIVLGFGVDSAKKFNDFISKTDPISLEESPLQMVGSFQPKNCKIQPVEFIGDPNILEVQKLLDRYSNQIVTIWKKYRDKALLETIFSLF